MSSQRDSNVPSPIELQQTGVPADYSDPNHPHFPTDTEAQLPRRSFSTPRTCLSKRFVYIIFGLVLGLGLVVGGVFLGIKLGTDQALAEHQESSNGTTYVTTTTVFTVSTIHATPTPTLSIIGIDLFPTPEPSRSPCTNHGSWPTLEKCDENCAVRGNMTACGVWTGGFTCVVCPLTQAKASYYLPHN